MLERARLGAPEGLWLRADAQDSGRGRLGRAWHSPEGNVFASTIIRIGVNDPPASTLAFVAALAAYDTVKLIAPDVAVRIKWPNDLLSLAGEKLSGMLLERAGDAVIIGIGINLVSHPDDVGRPVTDLATLGANPPSPQTVVEILADMFSEWVDRWRLYGMSAVAQAWQKNAHPLGTALTVNLPDGQMQTGLYAGLSEDGALMLRLADGSIRAIHAADVFLV